MKRGPKQKAKPKQQARAEGPRNAGSLAASKPAPTFPHYWLCHDCAIAKGGSFPEDHACTVSYGTCPYCKQENVMVIPWVDFDWPHRRTAHLRD